MAAVTSPSDPLKIWRQHAAKLKENPEVASATMHVGIAGTFTVDPLVPYLGGCLLEKGFEEPDLAIAPYNQIHQLCFNPAGVLDRPKLDTIIVLWRLEDMVPDLLLAALSGDAQAMRNLFDEIGRLLDAISTLRKKHEGILIVATPPYPSLSAFDVHDLEQTFTGSMLYHKILRQWTEGLHSIGTIKVIDLHGLLCQIGYQSGHDVRKWYLYRQPYSEAVWAKVGTQLARTIAAETISAKKCVVVDCDNTLWGGIVGEEGLAGIELGEDFPGRAFRDFQKYLLHLRNKGIFLAVASKNNSEDVYEVFDNHDAMAFSRAHISVFEVHWQSKVESLKRIAATLNIGTDALVFVDDNPKEIAEVQERLPEVTCFLVPEETAWLPDLLRNSGLFDIAELTEEDRKRSEMMNAERQREQIREEQSEEDFLNSLKLVIKVFEAQPTHIARVSQLINKTNQFNLTTVRRSADEVKALAGSDDARIFAMEVNDRFGEYGLVGVAIVTRSTDREWYLDTLLMSCRVLGRSAETSFIAKVAEAVRHNNGDSLRGEFRPTCKNALVKDFFKNHGFLLDEASGQWLAHVDAVKQPPEHVSVSLILAD